MLNLLDPPVFEVVALEPALAGPPGDAGEPGILDLLETAIGEAAGKCQARDFDDREAAAEDACEDPEDDEEFDDNPGASPFYVPSPADIARETATIRDGWTESQRQTALGRVGSSRAGNPHRLSRRQHRWKAG